MGGRINQRIENLLDEAENHGTCAVPPTRSDARQLQRACARGEVVRPKPGIYARASYWDGLDPLKRAMHEMRALATLHPSWVFGGASAALAHGLDVGYREVRRPTLAVSDRMHSKSTSTYRRIIVASDIPVRRKKVNVTSFLRTVYDCLRTMDFPEALAIADSSLRTHQIDSERLALNIRKSCPGLRSLSRVLDIVSYADGRSENGGESKVRAAIMSLGFAVPDLQREVQNPLNPTAVYRVDFAWDLPDGSVVYGELDGVDKYVDANMTEGKSPFEVMRDERRRESRITLGEKPVRILRFSFEESQDARYFGRLLEAYGIPRVVAASKVAAAAVV